MATPPPLLQPNYYGPGEPGGRPPLPSGLAVASMVCGIVSVVGLCVWCVSGPVAIVAVVLGLVARGQCRRGVRGGRGMAIAGLACGTVTLAVQLFGLLAVLASHLR